MEDHPVCGNIGKAVDAAHTPVLDKEQTKNLQATAAAFPFLKLPAEIRNQIYRLVLLTQNVSTYTAPHYSCRALLEIVETVFTSEDSEELREAAIGTVRCKSWRKYTLDYQVSILRTSRQIHGEALGIFQLENFWVFVSVNKREFAKEMKDLGFPVATGINIWRYIKFCVLSVTVVFPSLELQPQSSTLLIATPHLKQLVRALWTAQGASEMKVAIAVQRPHIRISPDESNLLRPFFKLRSINEAFVTGVSKGGHIDELRRAMTTDSMIGVLTDLTAGVKYLQRYIKTEKWDQAIAQANKHSIFQADCKLVYGNGLSTTNPRPNWLNSFLRHCVSLEITVATDLAKAEVSLHLQNHTDTFRFAQRALEITETFEKYLSDISTHQPIAVVNLLRPHPNKLFPYTGTLPSDAETKSVCHLLLARAYVGLEKKELARVHINKARALMPASVTRAAVCSAWRRLYGSSFPTPGLTRAVSFEG